ncbi:hypothetical protein BDR07DRAFT_1376378 [Suillus spraguei]|nr:hypothetical protein BDR07DRAFT_1376378 [Suillus spraguei]
MFCQRGRWQSGGLIKTMSDYNVKTDGPRDLLVSTEDKLVQLSPARRTGQTFLLLRPWNRYDLGPIDFAGETQNVEDWLEPESPSDDAFDGYLGHNGPVAD